MFVYCTGCSKCTLDVNKHSKASTACLAITRNKWRKNNTDWCHIGWERKVSVSIFYHVVLPWIWRQVLVAMRSFWGWEPNNYLIKCSRSKCFPGKAVSWSTVDICFTKNIWPLGQSTHVARSQCRNMLTPRGFIEASSWEGVCWQLTLGKRYMLRPGRNRSAYQNNVSQHKLSPRKGA